VALADNSKEEMVSVQLVTYDPFAPGFIADPYPQYRLLRAENPAHFTKFGFLLLTRYRDVVAAYEDTRLSRDMRLWQAYGMWRLGSTDGPLERMMANWLVLIDPPRHTPLRAIHDSVFTHDLASRAAAITDQAVADLLGAAASGGTMDVIGDYAGPLPVHVISALLGLPREDWPEIVPWSNAIAMSSEPRLSPEILAAATAAMEAMKAYFAEQVARRRREPTDDLLSKLALTEHDGQRLSDEELLDSVIFLYQAGHPTTTHLIGLGLLALLRHPDQLERLRRDPSLLSGAIEELNRYDGPVQMNGRVATEDLEFLGVPVKQGQLVRLCLGSANRDAGRFPEPDRLDITREVGGHLGFGKGIHYCVGAELGRLQARTAIGALLERAPGLRLASEDLQWSPSASNRALTALPVEL
jgi:cytochrome P450